VKDDDILLFKNRAAANAIYIYSTHPTGWECSEVSEFPNDPMNVKLGRICMYPGFSLHFSASAFVGHDCLPNVPGPGTCCKQQMTPAAVAAIKDLPRLARAV
jgi:hypothetical protein